MAINLTPDDVRELCPTNASDAVIQMYIDVVIEKYEQCLEGNYSEATAKLLATMATCVILSNSSNSSGKVKSKRAPNGSSISYDTSEDASGMYNNIEAIDTSGCLTDLLLTDGVFAIGTAGSNLNDTNGCC